MWMRVYLGFASVRAPALLGSCQETSRHFPKAEPSLAWRGAMAMGFSLLQNCDFLSSLPENICSLPFWCEIQNRDAKKEQRRSQILLGFPVTMAMHEFLFLFTWWITCCREFSYSASFRESKGGIRHHQLWTKTLSWNKSLQKCPFIKTKEHMGAIFWRFILLGVFTLSLISFRVFISLVNLLFQQPPAKGCLRELFQVLATWSAGSHLCSAQDPVGCVYSQKTRNTVGFTFYL